MSQPTLDHQIDHQATADGVPAGSIADLQARGIPLRPAALTAPAPVHETPLQEALHLAPQPAPPSAAQSPSAFGPTVAPAPVPVLPLPAGPSDAAVLAARGTTVLFTTGEKQLRYDFAALLAMEEEFGTIAGMDAELRALQKDGIRGPILARMVRILHIGLRPYYPAGQAGRDALVAEFRLDQLGQYMDALGNAVSESFGTGGSQVSGASGAGGASEQGTPSRGAGSTTSPSSPAG